MDQSYSDSDISLSPSQLLDRLQVLRQLQLLQRGKLQKQRLQYEGTSQTSSSITEIVSQFSNSTSYTTFRSLLQSSCDVSSEVTPRPKNGKMTGEVQDEDLLEGVTALNLSQESEFIVNSPLSSKSKISVPSKIENHGGTPVDPSLYANQASKKQIALDDMPILSPKKDFEELLLEKLQKEKAQKPANSKKDQEFPVQGKKPFLKKGEGMARFGVKRNDLVIQSTKSLPWKKKSLETRVTHTPKKLKTNKTSDVQIMIKETKPSQLNTKAELKLIRHSEKKLQKKTKEKSDNTNNNNTAKQDKSDNTNNNNTAHTKDCEINHEVTDKPVPKLQLPTGKHPLKLNREKTWAAVLTKEQDEFLRQLKQSEYYKNFVSPAKSAISDTSCDNHLTKLSQEREVAEQNMFELLENKVTNESFSLENSFFNKFLKRSMECSGESTPLMMQRCLTNNPQLLHIFPDIIIKNDNHTECSCEYTDCSDTSSVCSNCSCKTIEQTSNETPKEVIKKDTKQKDSKTVCIDKKNLKDTCLNDKMVTETDEVRANMAEMNAKLAATSELLKERLRELEDEIETFKQENNNLTKLREEVDLEKQKFYEEKNAFESKFNEEKILSEYYLAEEKEKLNKQKQMYERYVREMRGRLNKKEKDEVVNLKKEINDLKEEIRLKDAKSTTTIARLRNQLKIIEKDKINLQEEVEKLKKENRRIHHSNEITRRLTNVKYLEEINKKLTKMSKNTISEVDLDNNVKYKSYEIERQSRSKNVQPIHRGALRPRAKSVPNLNVTSRYAKYFSQRDALSHAEQNDCLNIERADGYSMSDNEHEPTVINLENKEFSDENDEADNEEGNHLERIYMERFHGASPVSTSNRSSSSNDRLRVNPDPFFIQKSSSNSRNSKSPNEFDCNLNSPVNIEKLRSPIPTHNNKPSIPKQPTFDPVLNYTGDLGNSNRSKSPISILSTHSSNSQKSGTVISQEKYSSNYQKSGMVINHEGYRNRLMNVSPEPSTSKTSLSKTNLNPIEIKKSDGSKELRFPNGNVKYISADGKYSKFVYYNGDVKENFYSEGRIKYYYSESKTYHTTYPDGLEVLEFPDGQVEKRYKDGSTEIRLPNGSIRYNDPKNEHVREEWRFPDGTSLTVSANGEQRIVFSNGQVEVHANDHKRREFPDGTVKLVYNDGTSETRYASGRVRIKDKHGNLIMDSAPG